MSSRPFMQLYISDYFGDTQHLTTEQHGAYLLMLMTMWQKGGSLPNDQAKLARIARVSPRRWHIIAGDVMEFFDIEGDQITQKRLVEELQKCVSISEIRSSNGKAGALAKALKNNNQPQANAKQVLKHSQIPDTINKTSLRSSNAGKKAISILEGLTGLPDEAYMLQRAVAVGLQAGGFEVQLEAATAGLGDVRNGRVDILATIEGGAVAIEIDARRPKPRSINKLKLFDAFRIVALRGVSGEAPEGIDAVVALDVCGLETAKFDEFWSIYPMRAGANSRKLALKKFTQIVQQGVSPNDIIDGIRRYAAWCEVTGKIGTEWVKTAVPWFNAEMWKDPWTLPARAPPPAAKSNGWEQAARKFLNDGNDDEPSFNYQGEAASGGNGGAIDLDRDDFFEIGNEREPTPFFDSGERCTHRR